MPKNTDWAFDIRLAPSAVAQQGNCIFVKISKMFLNISFFKCKYSNIY